MSEIDSKVCIVSAKAAVKGHRVTVTDIQTIKESSAFTLADDTSLSPIERVRFVLP